MFEYSLIELQYDDRFNKDEKLSIYASHMDEFETLESALRGLIIYLGMREIISAIKRAGLLKNETR